MTPIKLTGEYFGVSIPEDALLVMMVNERFSYVWMETAHEQILPPGKWLFIGTSENLTEEQAAEIVQEGRFKHKQIDRLYWECHWKNYHRKNAGSAIATSTAIESFRSLLSSLGIKDRIAIIKQVK